MSTRDYPGCYFYVQKKGRDYEKRRFCRSGHQRGAGIQSGAGIKEGVGGYVPKTDLEALNATKVQLEKDIKTRDKQLEELKKASGSSEELQKQITDLQAENKAAKEKYEADMKELKLTTAIKLAIGDSAMTLTLCPDLLIKASCS